MRRPTLAVAALAALAVTAGPAAADPGPDEIFLTSAFEAAGSDGFAISVTVQTQESKFARGVLTTPPRITIEATRKNAAGDFLARYSAQGKSVNGQVVFDLGKLGRISGRLSPVGRAGTRRFPGCRTGTVSNQAVVLSGAVRFRGEDGFTVLSRRQLRGVQQYSLVPPARCKAQSKPPKVEVIPLSGTTGELKLIPAGASVFAQFSYYRNRARGTSLEKVVVVKSPAAALSRTPDGAITYTAPEGTMLGGALQLNSGSPLRVASNTLQVTFPGIPAVRVSGTEAYPERTNLYQTTPSLQGGPLA